MIYIDSNVFIFAALNNEELGNSAKLILEKVENRSIEASTSSLTFDEVVWIVKKNRSFEDAVSIGDAFLGMEGLHLIDVNQDLLALAISIMKKYKTDPRDSIHAATAITQKAAVVISEESDFDKITEIKKIGIREFK
ncbi:type II toxin-antitoxin system VapC family toxin [Ferroplasma acidiphilum]|uniref:type II toxin-antitoxin system VapC family toxin n=1 Tax=Ferroplasma acidiphilum TaxID=74969 RepID=UPI0023F19714|nr:type II toxin-antitoxin system VapC family toxin [Ferroplasma acidiphilum]MCL4349414.1 type II toxin-antitoxin system VapC family toxin [Candidatus Thermoplasmatota archaeon]WMT52340.1 MAG: type II toxin-antitoxin system VapC family toxin [Ferroplasma acidiphilum]